MKHHRPAIMHMDGVERWEPIPSLPGYSASTHGRIKRDANYAYGIAPKRTHLKPRPLNRGHLGVSPSINGKVVHRLVHRLVAEVFLPPQPDGKPLVCHVDDDPTNNRPENLFWGSHKDNTSDMIAKGRNAFGSENPSSKLTPEKVRAIRSMGLGGAEQRDIAAAFGIAQSNVSLILSGKTWKSVT